MSLCSHFPACGGCSILSKSYSEQLIFKMEILKRIFSSFNIQIQEIVPSPLSFFYRHKVQLPFGFDRKRKTVTLGCYAVDTHDVIDQKECLIQDKDLSIVVASIREWAKVTKLSSYNEKSGTGFLRHVLIRKGVATGEILIGLVTNGEQMGGTRFLSRKLLDIIGKKLSGSATVVGIVQNVNMRTTNVVLGQKEITWWGRPYIKEQLGELKFKVGLSTFFQVNPFQTPNLYNEVLSWVPDNAAVFDLYSGTGTIGLWIARKAKIVIGIEENRESVRAARTAAEINGVKNVRFVEGDTAEKLPGLIGKDYAVAVVDPPRKGLDNKLINTMLHSALKKIIYVSCNPETLKRDIDMLKEKYELLSLKGFDMFPQTEHIECVAVLNLRTVK
ncbi:MAG: 23S rRNA (uracil(1939)-C(5))-methyltransferase RlmD [Fibrobacter sp.]|nr:23S rRNA (uracil(1939)-C(5))-methyltransferase RlmD [Fibrobacter sp.]